LASLPLARIGAGTEKRAEGPQGPVYACRVGVDGKIFPGAITPAMSPFMYTCTQCIPFWEFSLNIRKIEKHF